MTTEKRTARSAGVWYLLLAIFYSFSMIYADSTFYVPGDAAATIQNILASESIFRLGFVSCLAGHVCLIIAANLLFKLFSPVDGSLARLMLIFAVIGVSIAFLNGLGQYAAYMLLSGKGNLSAFEPSQLQGLAMFLLVAHKHGALLATIFWGLWLLPLGMLIIKSDLVPKALGVMLICACFCYLMDFAFFFFFPGLVAATDTALSIVESLAEVALIAWLLIKGVKDQRRS